MRSRQGGKVAHPLRWRRRLILVDAKGRVGFAFNSARMARAWIDADGVEGSGFGKAQLG